MASVLTLAAESVPTSLSTSELSSLFTSTSILLVPSSFSPTSGFTSPSPGFTFDWLSLCFLPPSEDSATPKLSAFFNVNDVPNPSTHVSSTTQCDNFWLPVALSSTFFPRSRFSIFVTSLWLNSCFLSSISIADDFDLIFETSSIMELISTSCQCFPWWKMSLQLTESKGQYLHLYGLSLVWTARIWTNIPVDCFVAFSSQNGQW